MDSKRVSCVVSCTIEASLQAPIMNLCTSKNYVVANAVETILAAPKKIPDNAKESPPPRRITRLPEGVGLPRESRSPKRESVSPERVVLVLQLIQGLGISRIFTPLNWS